MRAARLLTGVFLALQGWNALAQALPPYKMVDSGFPVDVVSKDIYWVDDTRVLFRGVVLATYDRGLRAAYVWDTRQNKVEPYSDSQKGLASFCSHNGYVSYIWQGKLYAGMFGSEVQVPGSYRNPHSCKPYADRPPAMPLLEEHGWLDVSGPSTIVLRRDGNSPGVETSIPKQPIEVRYLPWAKQYLVIGKSEANAKTAPAWYLRPDGSSTEVKWPAGEWQASPDYLATRMGLLVWARQGADPKTALYGHFLLRGGVATRIAQGNYWKGTSVSPDGCKIAFRHALNRDDEKRGYAEWKAGRPANTLRMIDVCAPARADPLTRGS